MKKNLEYLVFMPLVIFSIYLLVTLIQPKTCLPYLATVIDLQTTSDRDGDVIHTVFYKDRAGEIREQKNVENDLFYSLEIGGGLYIRHCKGDWLGDNSIYFDGKERIEE